MYWLLYPASNVNDEVSSAVTDAAAKRAANTNTSFFIFILLFIFLVSV
jgi:hypothetical protein